MKRVHLIKLGLMTLGLLLFSLGAQARKLTPLPSIPDYTRGSGIGYALGGKLEFGSPYAGSDEYGFAFAVVGGLHWSMKDSLIYLEEDGLGWRGYIDKEVLMQIGLRYDSGLSPDDSDDGSLDGIDKRDSHLVGFIDTRRSLGRNWDNWLGARVEGGLSDYGWVLELSAGHLFRGYFPGTGSEIILFTSFATADNINRDFGISSTEAVASGLAETELDGGYRSTGIRLLDRRNLASNFQILWEAGAQMYSSDISDSPIASQAFEFNIGFSLFWHY